MSRHISRRPSPEAPRNDLPEWEEAPARTYGARRGAPRRTYVDAETLPPRLRQRRAYTLVGLTFVLPGSAQIVAGNRRLGKLVLKMWGVVLTLVLVALVLAFVERSWLLGLLTRTPVLMTLAVLLGLLAVLWVILFIDAARLAHLKSVPASTRRRVVALTLIGTLVTGGPLGWGASSLYSGGSALGKVFGSGVSKEPSKGRYNILLLGSDSGAGRTGTRPDTIMLASVDAKTGQTTTFGFARNTENINFRPGSTMAKLMPKGWNCGDECLLNGLYAWAMERKDQFPISVKDPGALATKEAVESLSGLDIQYYAMIDLKGFQTMVDAVGGLDLITKTKVPVGGGSTRIYEYIQPGKHHFNGFYALWYARSREGSTDYERMARQRCVVQAAMKQLDPQTVILRFRDLISAGTEVLQTDIPQSDLGALGDLVLRSRSQPLGSVNFVPPLIKPWDYDPRVIRDTVAQKLATGEGSSAATQTPNPGAPANTPKAAPSASTGRTTTPSATPKKTASGPGGGAADSGRTEPGGANATSSSDICVVP